MTGINWKDDMQQSSLAGNEPGMVQFMVSFLTPWPPGTLPNNYVTVTM